MVRMAACLVVVVWAAALSVIDLRRRRLPDVLTLTGAAVVLTVCIGCGRGLAAIVGALALAVPYLLIHLVDPAGLGGGDVKLAVGLGALTGALGAPVWVLAALGAPLLTAVLGTAVMLSRGATTVPHGPSMCLASLAAAALAVF